MPGLLATFRVVAGTHVHRVVRARRMIIMLVLALIPAIPVFVISRIRGRGHPETLIAHVSWSILLQVVLPLISLIGGSAAAQEEIADRTITYVFVRPVSRAGFYLGRFFATLVAVEVIVAMAVALIFACARHRSLELSGFASPLFSRVLLVALGGGAVYTAVFSALGAWLKHPMIVGIGYVFAIEGLLANFPGSSQSIAIQYHLRSAMAEVAGPAWDVVMTETLSDLEPPAEAWRTLAIIFVVAVLLGVRFLQRRQAA